MLGHDRDDVRVVVLHEYDVRGLGAWARLGPPPGLVAGVCVGDDARRFDLVHGGELRHRVLERHERLDAAHVADVLTHPRVAARSEAERVLELAADGESRRDRDGQRDRQRRVAARPADRQLLTVDDPHNGVVARHVDRAIVREPRVGDAAQSGARVGILERDRFVGEVAARQHQDLGYRRRARRTIRPRREQQMVQRRVRQHHADERVARGDERRQRRIRTGRDEHDRPGR